MAQIVLNSLPINGTDFLAILMYPAEQGTKVERTGGYAHLRARLLNEYTSLNLSLMFLASKPPAQRPRDACKITFVARKMLKGRQLGKNQKRLSLSTPTFIILLSLD